VPLLCRGSVFLNFVPDVANWKRMVWILETYGFWGDPKSRADGMTERRSNRMTERRKINRNPKRWDDGMEER